MKKKSAKWISFSFLIKLAPFTTLVAESLSSASSLENYFCPLSFNSSTLTVITELVLNPSMTSESVISGSCDSL